MSSESGILVNEGQIGRKLRIRYVTDFDFVWSAAQTYLSKGSFWKPRVPAGFHSLGDFVWASHDNPSNNFIMIVVQEVEGSEKMLAPPIGFELIWTDLKSGAKYDVSVWQPIAPEGYVALGTIVTPNYHEPSLDSVKCVKSELTDEGVLSHMLYEATNAYKSQIIWAQAITAPSVPNQEDSYSCARLASGSFASFRTKKVHTNSLVNHVLKVDMPIKQKKTDMSTSPLSSPTNRADWIRGFGYPENKDSTRWVIDEEITVPLVSVVDPNHDRKWQIENSQYYTIRKKTCFRCVDVTTSDGKGTVKLKRSKALTVEKSKEISKKMGFNLGFEAGGGMGPVNASVSMGFNLEMGVRTTESTGTAETKERTVTRNVKPNSPVALWEQFIEVEIWDARGNRIATTKSLSQGGDIIIAYPPHGPKFDITRYDEKAFVPRVQ